MRIIERNGFPIPKGYIGITLWPFGIYVIPNIKNSYTVNHEKIHWAQQKELPVLFYVLYGLFYIVNLCRYKFDTKKAYYAIPFEIEAYIQEDNTEYLQERYDYAWLKYI